MNFNNDYNLECTINLHKRTFGKKFKNRAAITIKEIKNFVYKTMKIKDIKIDTILNKKVWKNGRKNVSNRLRVRLSKKLAVSDEGKDKWVVFVNYINMNKLKTLVTEKF